LHALLLTRLSQTGLLKLPHNPKAKGYQFTERGITKFAAVRAALSIPPELFLTSFTELPSSGAVCSGGRSGSVVVSTRDDKYVVVYSFVLAVFFSLY
jgi:hypothetical protein